MPLYPEKIKNLQNSLIIIRTVAGITADDFAKRIGLSRVHYESIETGKSRLTLQLYYALLYIIDQIPETAYSDGVVRRIRDICLFDLSEDVCRDVSNYISKKRKYKLKLNRISGDIFHLVFGNVDNYDSKRTWFVQTVSEEFEKGCARTRERARCKSRK